MKEKLRKILIDTVSSLGLGEAPPFEIERPKVKAHGELSANLALLMARRLGKKPQEVAKEILAHLVDREGMVEKAEVAGPGFLNFTIKRDVWRESLREVLSAGPSFGRSQKFRGKKMLVEFVSANPTGPVHIGNARGGPLGDVLASLSEAVGYSVTREFYVNDIGGQIDKLGNSLYTEICRRRGKPVKTEVEYSGEYLQELATSAEKRLGEKIPEDSAEGSQVLGRFAVDQLLEEIRRDCNEMGLSFDSWVHEKEVLGSTRTEKVLVALKSKGVTVEKEGALWLAVRDDFLQDRECVLVRSDRRPTYFANDIAYHVGKYERGFDRIVNVWGSNHHGHVPRIQAALQALGFDPARMETILYQYVRVKRGNESVKMSKRAGNFVTAREVLDEVGRDAFRFFLLMRAPESHLDFDLDLAKKQSQDNPVYYVQYAHARLASIERKALEMKLPPVDPSADLNGLNLPEEIELIRLVNEFPDEVEFAAERKEPHRVVFYLLELAKLFQAYYARAREDPRYHVLSGAVDTSQAKRYLCAAIKLTLSQGLGLLGVSAPEIMIKEENEVKHG